MCMYKSALSLLIFLLLSFQCSKNKPVLSIAVGGAPNELDYWQKILNDFQDQTSIAVTMLRQPTDTDQRRQNLVIPLKSREPDPDIFLMDMVWVGQFAYSGWLMSLDPYIKKNKFDISKFFPSVIGQIDTHNNNIIAIPVYIDSGVLYYREDLLKIYDSSVPETWEDLVNCSVRIQERERKTNPGFYGFVWQGAQYEGLVCNFLEFISSNNGELFKNIETLSIADIKNIKALQFMTDLIHKYKISPPNTYTEIKEEEARLYFQNGNSLFERNWPYAAKLHDADNSPVKGKWGMTVLPKFKNGRYTAASGGWHLGISKYSDKKEDAWRLLEYIASYKIQKKFAVNIGWNPGRRDIYSDPYVIKEIPVIRVLKKAFASSVSRPVIPYYTQFSEILQIYVNRAIAGVAEPAKALEESQTEIRKLVEAYNE